MVIPVVITVLAVLLVAAVAVLAFLVGNRSRPAGERDRLTAELSARLAEERERTVVAAAEMAAHMAGEKLGENMASSTRLLDLRTHAFDKRVEGLGTQLERLGTIVSSLQHTTAEQHGQLTSGIEHVTTVGRALAESTGHLREVLASPKARGQWGERMAEDVLRAAGMVEGITYRKQTAIAGGTVPDFTFLLPGDRLLHMDVKFPIDNYIRHLQADSPLEQDAAAKAFHRDVRNRVKELNGRGYIDPEVTLDQVVLFIPNESVWSFIHEQDPSLIDFALGQKVVLCSPVTLFGVLAVIRQTVEHARLARASDEILQCLSGFRAQWSKYADAVDKVQRSFDSVQRSFDDVTGTRRRALERQLDRIDDLRAARGLPEAPAEPGDGEAEADRRAQGTIHAWPDAAGA